MAVSFSGSLDISGSLTTTGTIVMSGSIASASFATNATTASNANTSSYVVSSQTDATQNTRLTTIEAVTGSYALTSSLSLTSASVAAINVRTGSYANTGSNFFIGTQVITGSVYIANDLIVQGSSSLQNITASAVSVGTNTIILNTATPILQFGGISVFDSGSTMGRSGSLLWNSINDHWINVNPSGSDEGYNSAMVINGPKNTGSLGNEAGLTTNYIPVSQGEDHITDSIIFQSGSTSIGIGNTNPLVRFHVTQPNGIGLPTLGTSTGGLFIAGDGNQYGLYVGNDGNTGNAWIQSMRNNTATAYNILLNPVGGNVGIGTTSPGTKLEILSRAADADRTLPHNVLTLTAEQGNSPYGPFGGAILFKNRSYTSGMVESSRIRSVIYDDGAPNNFGGGLWFETTPTPGGTLTPSLVLNYQGRVGIGTTAPTHNLEIRNSEGSVYQKLNADFGIAYVGMETADDSFRLVTAQATPIQFYTDNTERMRITGGTGNDVVIGLAAGNPYTAASRGSIFLNGSSNSLYGWGTGGTARGYMYHNGTNAFLENSVSGGSFNVVQVGAGSINFSTNAATRMTIQSDGGVVIGKALGNQYSQTSTSGTTSIVDTGITYNTGDYGGYNRGATYQVVFNGNPNAGGSGGYFAQYMGIIMIYTGWSGSAVTTYINYTQLAVGNNISTLTLTPHFWNGSSQVSSVNVYSTGYQIRLRIDGYNSSYVGSDQSVYLTRLT